MTMNDFVVSLMLLGALSSQDGHTPFWATAGRFGVYPEGNGAVALFQASMPYKTGDLLQWHWGTSLGVGNGSIFLDETYGGLKWRNLRLDLGMKHSLQAFMASSPELGSMSVTGGNFMMSGNARSMPGYTLELEPLDIPFTGGHLQLSGRFGDYTTIDKRFVQGALVHNTAAFLHWHAGTGLTFTAGLDHYTMWGGTSPIYGVQKVSFGNYLRILTGSSGGQDASLGDQINSLGDHRGRELLGMVYSGDVWSISYQYDKPYDDRSGMTLRNYPDGTRTLSFSFKDKSRWISDIVYEFHTTMNQSGEYERREATDKEISSRDPQLYFDEASGKYFVIRGGADNYCKNFEYRSGWTAFGRQIGNPLFFTRGGEICSGTWNNLLQAHHLGLSGSLFHKLPYRLMLTASRNYGCWFTADYLYGQGTRFDNPYLLFSSGFTTQFPFLNGSLLLIPGVYYDRFGCKPWFSGSFAASLSLKYIINKPHKS